MRAFASGCPTRRRSSDAVTVSDATFRSRHDSATPASIAGLACHAHTMTPPTMLHRLTAEFIGTFWLVLGGCGSAVFAAKFASSDGASLGIGFLGVALAFGLTVLTGVYAFGTISGGHFNPAVTLGAAFARRVEWKAVPGYWVVQVIGGLVAGLVILGSTDDRAPASKGFAGLSIGLTLTLIHLISIPISNTSVNPARSTGVAFFNGDRAPAQL